MSDKDVIKELQVELVAALELAHEFEASAEHAWMAKCEAQRKRAKLLDNQLGEIMARINGDGGHHYLKVGPEQAVKDADDKWISLKERVDEAETTVEREQEVHRRTKRELATAQAQLERLRELWKDVSGLIDGNHTNKSNKSAREINAILAEPTPATEAEQPATQATANAKTCPACGKQNDWIYNSCMHCHAKLLVYSEAEPEQSTTQTTESEEGLEKLLEEAGTRTAPKVTALVSEPTDVERVEHGPFQPMLASKDEAEASGALATECFVDVDFALSASKAAIKDAIGLDDGLDGFAGQEVIKGIDIAESQLAVIRANVQALVNAAFSLAEEVYTHFNSPMRDLLNTTRDALAHFKQEEQQDGQN